MRILFLHGWHSVPGGVKPRFLAEHGHEVFNPALDDDDFERALATGQAAYGAGQPDVVVGSSRGGALAMNLAGVGARLVLLCPAWRRWGRARRVAPGALVLHSRADEIVPYADSVELIRASGLPQTALLEIGEDHRLATPAPLAAMLAACEGRIVAS
ncbi:MAG TPA: alpha/beta hydrolase [Gammaproteobacteria bacterium]|nr:alpha/beta hydrolase [Gammaproteobacteria bacterium]